MIELEIGILIAIISAIVGPILVERYKKYLNRNKDSELVKTIKSNYVIGDELENLLLSLNADRVWISQFHNGGNFYPSGKSIQKMSITYEFVKPRQQGIRDIFKNIPVSLFTKSIMRLYENEEILLPTYNTKNDYGLRSFAENLGAKSSYIFKLNSLKGDFIGSIGIEWCSRKRELAEDKIDILRNKAVSIGSLLGTTL